MYGAASRAVEREPERQVGMLSGRPPLRISRSILAAAAFACIGLSAPLGAAAQSLRGSTASLDRQNRVARQHDYSYIDTPGRLSYFAEQGWLVRVQPTSDFQLHGVSFPYARPEVDLFVRRLSAQYRAACGERLVVTSLTRPTTRQPRNASDRSVHPTGMALDVRYAGDRRCRIWLEGVLADLERAGVLEATRERAPVHYHIALFPRQYAGYVERLTSRQADAEQGGQPYLVRSGDSLWTIARSHGTTVDEIKDVNGLSGSRIYAGQVIDLPQGSRP